jgi:hypothetical protein
LEKNIRKFIKMKEAFVELNIEIEVTFCSLATEAEISVDLNMTVQHNRLRTG